LVECLFNTLYAYIVSYKEKFSNPWFEFNLSSPGSI
jgi:hypothetical protein